MDIVTLAMAQPKIIDGKKFIISAYHNGSLVEDNFGNFFGYLFQQSAMSGAVESKIGEDIDGLLREAMSTPKPMVVKIGANDGVSNVDMYIPVAHTLRRDTNRITEFSGTCFSTFGSVVLKVESYAVFSHESNGIQFSVKVSPFA